MRGVCEDFLDLAVRELDLAVETDLKNGVARVFDELVTGRLRGSTVPVNLERRVSRHVLQDTSRRGRARASAHREKRKVSVRTSPPLL